ncbi:MAG: hypothetical protein ABR555_20080, partial [Pyrinomonadaceae bacterium]
MTWFRKKKQNNEPVPVEERRVRTENVFVKCEECDAPLYKRDLEESLQVCQHCGYHFRLDARSRLEMLFDDDGYEEMDAEIISIDPLTSVNWRSYPEVTARVSLLVNDTSQTNAGGTGAPTVTLRWEDMLLMPLPAFRLHLSNQSQGRVSFAQATTRPIDGVYRSPRSERSSITSMSSSTESPHCKDTVPRLSTLAAKIP